MIEENRHNIQREIEEQAPGLGKYLDKERPFSVPERYFDDFKSRMMDKATEQSLTIIHDSSGSKRKLSKRFIKAARILSAAAVVLVILAAFYIFRLSMTPTDAFQALELSEVESYILSDISTYEEYWIIAQVELEESSNIPENNLDDEFIEDYLINDFNTNSQLEELL